MIDFKLKNLIGVTVITPFLLFGSIAFAATDDTDITSKVESKIANNATIAKSGIEVDTSKGVVTLKGEVNTENEASIAVSEAYSVPDVKDVDTKKLKVKGNDKGEHIYRDAYITAKVKGCFIREKLFGDKPIDVSGISVETKDGVVSLTGTADSEAQINEAVSLAKKVKGVKSVQSTVEVKK